MTHLHPPVPSALSSFARRPEHNWISDGSTLNPSPGALLKQRRDTAAGCRDRAAETLLYTATLIAVSDRTALVDNAARWTDRADQLQLLEDHGEVVMSTSSAATGALLVPSAAARGEYS
jgi:hypothetical protein